jgi:hypothetical protein
MEFTEIYKDHLFLHKEKSFPSHEECRINGVNYNLFFDSKDLSEDFSDNQRIVSLEGNFKNFSDGYKIFKRINMVLYNNANICCEVDLDKIEFFQYYATSKFPLILTSGDLEATLIEYIWAHPNEENIEPNKLRLILEKQEELSIKKGHSLWEYISGVYNQKNKPFILEASCIATGKECLEYLEKIEKVISL